MVRSVLLLGLVATVAHAAPPPPEAKIHFDAGREYYTHDKWADAVREFKRAFELAPLPDLLLNIARAETHLGHEEVAIGYLEQYLAAQPDADDSPSVRAEIDARRKALEDGKAARKALAAAETAKREAVQATAQAKASAAEAREVRLAARPKWPGVTLLAIGGVFIAGGLLAGVAAVSDGNQVSRGGAGNPLTSKAPTVWSPDEQKIHDGGVAAQAIGVALDLIGGLFAAVGAGMLVWALVGPRAEKRVWLAPGLGGVTVGGSFP